MRNTYEELLPTGDKNEILSPLGDYKEGMNWNPVEKVILERRSIRYFKKDPLPDNMIKRILEAGRFAPSAGNSQPWKFIVVKSPEIIAEMEKDAQKMARTFMKLLDYTSRKVPRKFLTKRIIKMRHNELHPVPFGALKAIAAGKVPVFFGAPTLIVFLTDKRGVANPYVDLGIVGQNIVLSAHSMGAATCWIGMVSLLMFKRKWKKFFRVKKPYELNNVIAIGWPKGRFDGEVPREVQLVEWIEGTYENPKRRIERQGE